MTAFEPLAEPSTNEKIVQVELKALAQEKQGRDMLLARMLRGTTVQDSFASIASTIASETALDRVSLLTIRDSKCILEATSTQPYVDRRTRQSRLLEQLCQQVSKSSNPTTFKLGTGDNSVELTLELESYLDESGVRELHIERIDDPQSLNPLAVIVLERFRVLDSHPEQIESLLSNFRQTLAAAVSNALERDRGLLRVLIDRWTRVATSLKTLSAVAVFAFTTVLSVCVSTDLEIPVDGTITASDKRHLFASHDGVVSNVFVHGGQDVVSGQPILTIRSTELELLEQSIQADLATSQTRLDAILALRGRDREAALSVDEQSLRSEIAGLKTQAELLAEERDSLTVRSPINGRVDAWELQQSFESRPVSRGQYLLDIVVPDSGWTLELDVPDQQMGYVTKAQSKSPCVCRVKLRSDAKATYTGTLQQIDNTAHLNAHGESVVRAKVKLDRTDHPDIRNGATVIAQVNCGKHSLGFVCFRGVIQWWRGLDW